MTGMAVTLHPLVAPPVLGDLIVRTLAPGEAVPPGWTVVGQEPRRQCYRHATPGQTWRKGDVVVDVPPTDPNGSWV